MAKRKTPIQHAEIVNRFAAKLREVRLSRGMTQLELSQAAKITTSYVGRLESGISAPGIDTVEKLAKALSTTSHDLLPVEITTDTEKVLRERAKELSDRLISSADRETLSMLVPLLARLGESPTRRR